MNNVRHYLDQYVKLTDDEWEIFSSFLIREKYLKKSLLLLKGEIENHVSFIVNGIVRYYIDKNDSQYTFGFSFEQEFSSAYDSFLTQKPSRYHVETLTDVELYRITYDDLQRAYSLTENGNELGRVMAENLYMRKFSRELSCHNESAEERYLWLITKQPYFLKQIPLQYIASYIGVTPQTLSKIRRRIS